MQNSRWAIYARIAGVGLGILVFAAADQARNLPWGLHLLHLSQLWKFQRIVHLVGLGLIVVFTVGEYIDRWIARILRVA
jgi:hypothetical protein